MVELVFPSEEGHRARRAEASGYYSPTEAGACVLRHVSQCGYNFSIAGMLHRYNEYLIYHLYLRAPVRSCAWQVIPLREQPDKLSG